MSGETDLNMLLACMQPVLHAEACVFCSVSREAVAGLAVEPLAIFHEQEGITLILTQHQASGLGLPYEGTWAWITLTVHSSLSAVGFLAVITTRLAQAGISVNPVSAYYHDHLFVPWEKRNQAMEVLNVSE